MSENGFATTARPRRIPEGDFLPETEADTPTKLDEFMPPHDAGAETALLGSVIADPECIETATLHVPDASWFFQDNHALVYAVVIDMTKNGRVVDDVTLPAELRKQGIMDRVGGEQFLIDCLSGVPSSAHVEHYARVVREFGLRRKMIQAGTNLVRIGHEQGAIGGVIEEAERTVFDLSSNRGSRTATPLVEVIHSALEWMDREDAGIPGLQTGYVDLDRLTMGLQPGEMVVLAARPSIGKTALALNITEHVAVDLHQPVLFVSMEMSAQHLGQRFLASRTGVDMQLIRGRRVRRQEREAMAFAVGELSAAPVFIEDTPGLSIGEVRTRARRAASKHGIKLVVLDYLQLMEDFGAGRSSRQEEVSRISRGVKALARELNVPVLCLSQLNRSSETENRRPRISDLRESGAIEQDADVVMLLHREAMLHKGDRDWMDANPDKVNVADLIVAKQRQGPCDAIKLTFMENVGKFVNYTAGV